MKRLDGGADRRGRMKPQMTVDSFWAMFDKNGPIHPVLGTRCWLWTGCLAEGYGKVRWKGRMWRVHRLVWFLIYGPTEKFVCHRCDVRACGNPEHLFAGTNDDNVADMISKGRNVASPGAFKPGPDSRRTGAAAARWPKEAS